MYDGKTQLLVANPINRYLINSPMLPQLKKNTDGSLTLYLQKDSPMAPGPAEQIDFGDHDRPVADDVAHYRDRSFFMLTPTFPGNDI
jgi:hypothetical protein